MKKMISLFVACLLVMSFCAIQVTAKNQECGFDVSALHEWCGDFSCGSIRMIGAVGIDENSLVTDDGNLWEVEDLPLTQDEFYLIWIADNFTEDVTDDIIIKVWTEAH